jgi:Zn-dependent M28 family amino/carboxypeptidase
MRKYFSIFLLIVFFFIQVYNGYTDNKNKNMDVQMIDIRKTSERLKAHLKKLTVSIGERSVRLPKNLDKTAEYIISFYKDNGVSVHGEPYDYHGRKVVNVVAEISPSPNPSHRYLLGAHYDSVSGTVGADDNASAIAVQLETARNLKALIDQKKLDLGVKFVSFALEEPPVYGTRVMGSRVYAKKARKENEKINGMICLEMVGYTCHEPGCQHYPFPLQFFGYPKEGNFIGIVGNMKSRGFTKDLLAEFQNNRDLPVIKLSVPFNGYILPAVRLSDHASFWDKGFKAVMITDSAFFRNPHYHLSSDTMDKLDYRFMAELVESLMQFFQSRK